MIPGRGSLDFRLLCRFESCYILFINNCMVTTDTTLQIVDADVNIYLEPYKSGFRIRYEIKKILTSDLTTTIYNRMLKSFSLGQNFLDAFTQDGINQKASLMQLIFRNEFGLSSAIINLIVE